MSRRHTALLVAASAAMGVSSSLFADRTTWTDGAGNGLWDDPLNWSNGVPTAADDAIFADFFNVQLPAGQTRQVGTFGLLSRFTGGRIETNYARGNPIIFSQLGALGDWLQLDGTGVLASPPPRPIIRGSIGDGAGGGNFGLHGTMQLFGDATYTGDTIAVGTIELRSALPVGPHGRLINTDRIFVPWASRLYAFSTVAANRIPDDAEIHLSGGEVELIVPAGEQFGVVTLAKGMSSLLTGNVIATSINRLDGTLHLATNAPVKLSNPPALPAPSSATDRPILPYIVGRDDVGVNLDASFVTYDSGIDPADPSDDVGVRALELDTEYNLNTLALGGNARIFSLNQAQNAAVKSLLMDGLGLLSLNAAKLTVDSAILFKDTNVITGSGSIEFPQHAYVWTDPQADIGGIVDVPIIEVPVSAPTMTISGPPGVAFLRPNSIPGGIHIVDGVFVSGAQGAYGGATITLTSGGFFIRDVSQSIGDVVIDSFFEQGPVSFNRPVTLGSIDASQLTINGEISGRGQLRTAGYIRLTGISEVEDLSIGVGASGLPGVLEIAGTLTHEPGGRLSLEQDQTSSQITGTGVFGGRITSRDGILAPGPGTGRFTIDELILDRRQIPFPSGDGGTLRFELNGTTPALSYDQLAIEDSLDIRFGKLDVLFGYSAQHLDAFTVFDNHFAGPVSGMFPGLPQGATFMAGGYELMIDYLGGDGNDITLTVVPEPSAVALVVFSGMMLSRLRRA